MRFGLLRMRARLPEREARTYEFGFAEHRGHMPRTRLCREATQERVRLRRTSWVCASPPGRCEFRVCGACLPCGEVRVWLCQTSWVCPKDAHGGASGFAKCRGLRHFVPQVRVWLRQTPRGYTHGFGSSLIPCLVVYTGGTASKKCWISNLRPSGSWPKKL